MAVPASQAPINGTVARTSVGHGVDARPLAGGTRAAEPIDLVGRVFADLNEIGIRYCRLRDGDAARPDESAGNATVRNEALEVDILVNPTDIHELERLLHHRGFERERAWGHAPHRFYIAYDPSTGVWVKIDVVDRLRFGAPVRALATDLAEGCLERRRIVDGVYVPTAEDKCATMLLHCLLDKARFDPHHRAELDGACRQVREIAFLNMLLRTYCGDVMDWDRIRSCWASDSWDTLLDEAAGVRERLASRARTSTKLRHVGQRIVRKIGRSFPHTRSRPLTVVLLAPDGAGKSTLAANLENSFYFPVRRIYMGLYGRESAPIRLSRIPGAGLAERVVRQWLRYAGSIAHRARGRFVVFDRYGYETLLQAHRDQGRAARLRRTLLAHACPRPDLVLLLDAPGSLLHARKHEHDPQTLERHRQAYLDLGAHLTNCAVLDATRDPTTVAREATARIWRAYAC